MTHSTDSILLSVQVNKTNLGDYAALVVDATIGSGISRQFEAFKSGFCQVCGIMQIIFYFYGNMHGLDPCSVIITIGKYLVVVFMPVSLKVFHK